MDDPQKERIGDYELLGLIGDGAQGRVYKARLARPASDLSTPSSDFVALKVVRITGEDEKLRLKFQEQADILRRLTHTNIVAYRDCFAWHAGEWDESQCLVMELLEGESLHDRLKKSTTGLPWPQVEEIFEQCLAGLIHARERGITHRDLKPSNIFLTTTGQAKLIDFDIARRDDSGQMSTAGFKGTFDYMAPDFITLPGFHGDEVSDIFSLGVCFYQALTGVLPFDPLGDSAHIGFLNRWRDNANPVPSFRPGVFRVLSNAKAVVARCLAARRDQRYPSFTALLEDFRKIRYRRVRHKNKDEYELLSVLGRGGFGEVFKARRISDGMLVAVKFLFSEKQSERFLKEAKILQQYPHPNLVKYVDFMVIEGATGEKQFFLVMEFLEGMPGWTLRPRLKHEGKLEVPEAVPLFCSYLSALQFLHDNPKPIIHRDIKPGNLYAPVGQPEKGKIFDLGVARDVTGTVTVGGVPGTLDYMAPEFAEAGGDRGSPQSDLYALGLCLYESLTGKTVFERLPTDLNSAWISFQDRIRTPPAIKFEADAFVQYPRLKQVLLTALAPAPSNRYASAADMRAELQAALRPVALETHASAGFDAFDVTMATAPVDAPRRPPSAVPPSSSPEPATLGTRAVVPSGLPQAVAAARAAKRPASSSPLRTALVAGVGLAALLMICGLGWFLLMEQGSEKNKEQARQDSDLLAPPPARPQPAASQPPPMEPLLAEPSPAPAKPAVEPVKSVQTAPQPPPMEPLLAEPSPTPAEPANPATHPIASTPRPAAKSEAGAVVSARETARESHPNPDASIDPLFTALRDSLPAKVSDPADWSACELALARLQAQETQPWPGLDAATKRQRLASLRAALAERATAYLSQTCDAAIALYAADKEGTAERERLVHLSDQTPLLRALLDAPHAEALKRVDVACSAYTVRSTLAGLPARIDQTDTAEALQTLAAAFIKLEATPGVTLTPVQVSPVEQAFAARYLALAKTHAKQAENAYAADRLSDGEMASKALADLAAAVPPRFGQAPLTDLARAVAVTRQTAETRVADAAAHARAQTEAVKSLDTLIASLSPTNTLIPCGTNTLLATLHALASYTPAQLADRTVKTKWETTLKTCSEQIEQMIVQTDSAVDRAERLKAAQVCLALPETDTLLGRRAASLRKDLAQQQSRSLLRITNGLSQPVFVSSAEFRRDKIAAGESKIWEIPVPGETLTLSVVVDVGDRNITRIETVKLPRAGGFDHTLGAQASALLSSVPGASAPTLSSTSAPRPQSPVPPSSPTPSTSSFLVIAVSPKGAALQLDGTAAEAGRVQVAPDETHKISATLKGYKPVEQYYKVKAGETRTIDILLEKETRSFLGF